MGCSGRRHAHQRQTEPAESGSPAQKPRGPPLQWVMASVAGPVGVSSTRPQFLSLPFSLPFPAWRIWGIRSGPHCCAAAVRERPSKYVVLFCFLNLHVYNTLFYNLLFVRNISNMSYSTYVDLIHSF